MTTQTELKFRSAGGGQTQNHRLRDYLVARPNEWIPMPELARVITATGIGAAVHSRIADCRRKFEMVIEHKGGRSRATGLYESAYRYVPGPDETQENRASAPG